MAKTETETSTETETEAQVGDRLGLNSTKMNSTRLDTQRANYAANTEKMTQRKALNATKL